MTVSSPSLRHSFPETAKSLGLMCRSPERIGAGGKGGGRAGGLLQGLNASGVTCKEREQVDHGMRAQFVPCLESQGLSFPASDPHHSPPSHPAHGSTPGPLILKRRDFSSRYSRPPPLLCSLMAGS